jgi:hypothetical protein
VPGAGPRPPRPRRLGEHGVDGREVREPRGLEAAAARVERHRPQIGPVTVRGAHGLGRLTGGVGHRVFQRLLLHPDPRLAQHRLDECADRGRAHPAERRHEELRLRPGAAGRVERREARRDVAHPERRGVGGRDAGPELGGDVARVSVAAPGGADRLVGELRARRAERRVQRRAADRQDAAVAAREGPAAQIRDGERQGLVR